MSKWRAFLDSFDSDGAHVLTLVMFTAGLIGMAMYVLHHSNVNDKIEDFVLATFSGFSGALLLRLKGSSSGPQQPPVIEPKDKPNGPGVS